MVKPPEIYCENNNLFLLELSIPQRFLYFVATATIIYKKAVIMNSSNKNNGG
jgi:hypothetical protein